MICTAKTSTGCTDTSLHSMQSYAACFRASFCGATCSAGNAPGTRKTRQAYMAGGGKSMMMIQHSHMMPVMATPVCAVRQRMTAGEHTRKNTAFLQC